MPRDTRLTNEVFAFFTRQTRRVDDYAVGCRIAKFKPNPAAELRHYFSLAKRIRKSDSFAQAALDLVDWDLIVRTLQEVA
jgi:hypothetical protein